MTLNFRPFIPPRFDDEVEEWVDITQFGQSRREYIPGLRDYGPKGFAWVKASRDFIEGRIDCDEYERVLDGLLEFA